MTKSVFSDPSAAFNSQLLAVNLPVAAKRTGIPVRVLRQEGEAGRLRIRQCGRTRIIMVADLVDWLGQLSDERGKSNEIT